MKKTPLEITVDDILHREKKRCEELKTASETNIANVYREYFDRADGVDVDRMFAAIYTSTGVPVSVRERAYDDYRLYTGNKMAVCSLANVQGIIYDHGAARPQKGGKDA